MQLTPPTRRPGYSLTLRVALLLTAAAAFAACDRHSAEDVPDNYGHGSSHERAVPDHQIDSSYHTQSFSDTAGTRDEKAETAAATPAASVAPTPVNHF